MRATELTERIVEDAIGPIAKYALNCHVASLALVKSGLLDEARVARGSCQGVGGQHSWVVCGTDVYASGDKDGHTIGIVDITAWSYGVTERRVWVKANDFSTHRPHFFGSIWSYGCPEGGGGDEVTLAVPLSDGAEKWLSTMRGMAGPLDTMFWARLLTHAPEGGWPSAEITKAAYLTPGLRALIPIDRVGMQTDLNPEGLYLP